MMTTIETKDEEIQRRTNENQIVHSEMDLVTDIYNEQLKHLQDVEHENEILRGNIHHLQEQLYNEQVHVHVNKNLKFTQKYR